MPVASSLKAEPAAPLRWRWWRRGLAGLAGLLLVGLIFYQPLGHWMIRYFGGRALAEVGITAEWKTSGNLLGGLTVDDLKLSGNTTAAVRSITLQHAALEYDLAALWRTGPGTLLKSLVLQNVEAEIDLTLNDRARPLAKPLGPKPKPKLPAVILPAVRIENLTLRMRLPQDQLVIRRFSLVLDPSAPGHIQAEELDLPGTPVLRHLTGITRLTPTTLTLEKTSLWPDTWLEQLVLDVAKLSQDEASVLLTGRQGETQVELSGKSGGWFTETTADLNVVVKKISQETLAFWGVPSGSATWQAEQVALLVRGPVLRPDQLSLDLKVNGGAMSLPGARFSSISLAAEAKAGYFSLTRLEVGAGSNTAKAQAQVTLPETWLKITRVPGQLDISFTVPALAELIPASVRVSGAAFGKAKMAFAERALTETTAEVSAGPLQIKGVPVESATSRLRLDQGVLKLEEMEVVLNAQNKATATGQLDLKDNQNLAIQWKAEAQDLARVPVEVRAGLLWPTAGRVQSEGRVLGAVTEWLSGDWKTLNGQGMIAASGLRINEATMESLNLRAEATQGTVRLEQGLVKLDEANFIQLSGGLNLTDAVQPLSAEAVVELPDLTKISAWSQQFSGPAFAGGAVALNWKGYGYFKTLQMNGQGKVLVKNLKVAGVPEVIGLAAEVTQSNKEVRIPKFEASAGPWRVQGSASYDGWHLTVPSLQAFVKNERLVNLSARVPVSADGVLPDSPLSLLLKVDQLDAAKLAAALGRSFPVQGVLTAEGAFSGTLKTLQGSLQATASLLKPAHSEGPKIEPAEVRITALVNQGKLTLNGTAVQRPLQPLTFMASLPLNLPLLMLEPKTVTHLPVSAQVRLPASSLAFLPTWVPALRSVKGTATADFTVTGTVGKPVWKGTTSLFAQEATFGTSALPTVKNVVVKLKVDERRLSLDEASVLLAGGQLRVTGGAGLDNLKDPLLDFKLVAQEVLLARDENLSLRADASITCAGRLSAALVKGQVDLVRGRVFKEIEFLPLSLPNDLPPPPPPTTLGQQAAPIFPPPFERWKFDVIIKTRDPIRLMGNVAKGNAVADLRFSGLGAKPELTGQVKLEEMWLRLPFSRLNITQGVVSFNKQQPFDPQIDVVGESNTGSRLVQVFVQGRALDPKVRLTSSPPLPEGEIASLLATGVTTSDLTSSADEAAGRAAFVLLKQTYRKLFWKAAMDRDDEEPPRLSFDFSVFGSDPARRGISAIYELSPKWRVIGKVGESGSFRGLLYYLIRFR